MDLFNSKKYFAKKTIQEQFFEELEVFRPDLNQGISCGFLGITCYIDFNLVLSFAKQLKEFLDSFNADLSKFHILYDVSEWAKQRTSVEQKIKDKLRSLLQNCDVLLEPVNFRQQLMHAKAYCFSFQKKKKRKGFVINTSANLTRAGFGLRKKESNIELSTLSVSPEEIGSFIEIFDVLKSKILPKDKRIKQDRLLRAYQLFAKGSFYHVRTGNLKDEVRFKLPLSPSGKKEFQGNDNSIFSSFGYEQDTSAISKDPLNIERIFKEKSKPFPSEFMRVFSVDTLLGRWIPAQVSYILSKKIQRDISPYYDAIQKIACDEKLDILEIKLQEECLDLKENGLIEADFCDEEEDDDDFEDDDEVTKEKAMVFPVIKRWRKKIENFRENKRLIERLIYKIQIVPDLLDGANRTLILALYDALENHLIAKKPSGYLKKEIFTYITAEKCDSEKLDHVFEELSKNAKKKLKAK